MREFEPMEELERCLQEHRARFGVEPRVLAMSPVLFSWLKAIEAERRALGSEDAERGSGGAFLAYEGVVYEVAIDENLSNFEIHAGDDLSE